MRFGVSGGSEDCAVLPLISSCHDRHDGAAFVQEHVPLVFANVVLALFHLHFALCTLRYHWDSQTSKAQASMHTHVRADFVSYLLKSAVWTDPNLIYLEDGYGHGRLLFRCPSTIT